MCNQYACSLFEEFSYQNECVHIASMAKIGKIIFAFSKYVFYVKRIASESIVCSTLA